jgi:hypothetical protein
VSELDLALTISVVVLVVVVCSIRFGMESENIKNNGP